MRGLDLSWERLSETTVVVTARHRGQVIARATGSTTREAVQNLEHRLDEIAAHPDPETSPVLGVVALVVGTVLAAALVALLA